MRPPPIWTAGAGWRCPNPSTGLAARRAGADAGGLGRRVRAAHGGLDESRPRRERSPTKAGAERWSTNPTSRPPASSTPWQFTRHRPRASSNPVSSLITAGIALAAVRPGPRGQPVSLPPSAFEAGKVRALHPAVAPAKADAARGGNSMGCPRGIGALHVANGRLRHMVARLRPRLEDRRLPVAGAAARRLRASTTRPTSTTTSFPASATTGRDSTAACAPAPAGPEPRPPGQHGGHVVQNKGRGRLCAVGPVRAAGGI